ncbi:MAG: sugar phosphate isomerase/epimerase [Verrucomicrobia bacterium]|nr:sugar phosphate isomerase/epimerase [Verrucomicrobiota bacterium]MBU1735073.1 sugar phosphate isomerase/epimerase [Verrucomicrobiota bacterium]MBU1857942.1 sugar phosphate isomerase/epimerase [Verrucomicrobiota bacterium]
MKPAICHYSLHRRWKAENWTLDRLMEEVKRLGLVNIDVHAGMLGAPDGAAARIKSALAKSGLTLSGFSMSNDFSSDKPEEFRAQVDTVKRWIQVAAQVCAPVSRIFGGNLSIQHRNDPVLRKQKYRQIMDGLGEVTREAEKHNLILALENHGGLPCTGEEQVEVIRAINSPSLKATIDVGNYMNGGQEGHIGSRLAAPYAAYVHFKDFIKVDDSKLPWGWNVTACGLGEGAVNHRACLEALRDAGYNGFVALEYEGVEDEQTGVPKSVAYMKRVMQGF